MAIAERFLAVPFEESKDTTARTFGWVVTSEPETIPSAPNLSRGMIVGDHLAFLVVAAGTTGTLSGPAPQASQAYFWTASWQAGEREADEDIRLGRTRRFSDINEAIAWLKQGGRGLL